MNQDWVNGTIDEVVGNTKRQFGKLTGNTGTQVKGAAQELKGKAENTLGKTKDAIHNAQTGPVLVERRDDGTGTL